MRRQACYTESIERREVKRALFGKYGENSGDHCAFLAQAIFEKCKSVITHWGQFELHRVSQFAFSIVVRKVGSKVSVRF
jgi:hypothetical protein